MAGNGQRGAGRIVKPIKDRVMNMVARAVVQLVNEATKLQEVQLAIQDEEVRDECERMQQYGFSSKPLPGAEAVVIFVGGNRDHPLVTNVDDRRYRPKFLQDGEVVVYNHTGDYVHIKANGNIEVVAATEVTITCPLVTMTGNLRVEGDITDRYTTDATTMHGVREVYNTHQHTEQGDGALVSTTNQPLPV